jgi:hypothetical protein
MISMSLSTPNMQEQTTPQPLQQHVPQRCAKTKTQYACLYTHQKTQKRKTWQDGRLEVKGSRIELYAACPKLGAGDPILDVVEITNTSIPLENQLNISSIIETEKFLIDIQGPWQIQNTVISSQEQTQTKCTQQQASQPLISNGMKKVMGTKFRKPQSHGPPKLPLQPNGTSTVSRKRPLQPGELIRQYYGDVTRLQSSQELSSTGSYWQAQPQSRSELPPYTLPKQPSREPTMVPASETCENTFQQRQGIVQMKMMKQQNYSLRTESHPPTLHSATISKEMPIPDPTKPPPTQNTHSNQSTTMKRTMFSCLDNGFQASQFYGEEEEDKEEGLPEVFCLAPSQPAVQAPSRTSPSDTNNGNSYRLSTSQLLDLFGANKPKVDATDDDFVLPPNDDSDDET